MKNLLNEGQKITDLSLEDFSPSQFKQLEQMIDDGFSIRINFNIEMLWFPQQIG